MSKTISFDNLGNTDLIVDAIYKGGSSGNASDDPISKILKCGVQGGFRYAGRIKPFSLKFIVLYSSLSDPDWPDYLDFRTGVFTYYGDNKRPGHELHDTPRKGNVILKNCFDLLASKKFNEIPPIFVFTKAGIGRDVIFRGVAVPGAKGLESTENLTAIWKSQHGERFQNYKAIFSILNIPIVTKEWIADLNTDITFSVNTPQVFKNWLVKGVYNIIQAEKSIEYRTKEEQLSKSKADMQIINCIYDYFKNPFQFECFAADIVKLMDQNVVSIDLTRPWVDGGRDGLGKYRIGGIHNSIDVDFALEAKRYNQTNSVGVRETSRLISRIRHRQFGVMVTTSYVHRQAYKEINEDGHPIIIISAIDIISILKQSGFSTLDDVKEFLERYD